jgi:Protein of unknown function with HXXEE motif
LHLSLATLGWLFTLGVLVHNTEEAIWLPAWAASVRPLRFTVSSNVFRFAAVAQSLLLVLLTAAAFLSAPRGPAAYGFAGYVFAMLINVFVPHVVASIALRKYMPGMATAVGLNLPLGLLFLHRALADGFVVWGTLVWAAPFVAFLVLLSIPILFAIGRICMPIRS